MELTVKTFADSGCMAHLIGCARTGKALIVDPKLGKRASYLKTAADFGLTIVAVLDTHTHADHLSESLAFLRGGVELWMSRRTGCARPHRGLAEGDELAIGDLRFRALELPGHTPDSIAIVGHGLVACGDTLFAGGLARADFRGSDPARLFDSVKAKLMTLPDDTVVLSGHGYRDVLFTTIGHERRHNPDLRHASGAAYASALGAVEGVGNTPEVDAMLALNVAASPDLPTSAAPAAACCMAPTSAEPGPKPAERRVEELASSREQLTRDGRWYDVRDPHEFRHARIPGAANYPLSELGFHLAALRKQGPVVLQCRSGVRSMTAAKTLSYLGVLDQPINLHGGILRWQELGQPIDGGRVD